MKLGIEIAGFVFSKDYKGPGFGFLTKARMYDKWGHFSGSAAGVLMFIGLIRLAVILGGLEWNIILEGFCIYFGAVMIFTIGLIYEIYQGIIAAIQESERTGFIPVRYYEADGFSVLDLICNVGGIALAVWILI